MNVSDNLHSSENAGVKSAEADITTEALETLRGFIRCDEEYAVKALNVVTKRIKELEKLNLTFAENELKLQKLEAQQQWISVEDRLPSESERLKESIVLVADNFGNTYMAFLRRPRINDNLPVFLNGYRGVGLANVCHWMPLPKAPE